MGSAAGSTGLLTVGAAGLALGFAKGIELLPGGRQLGMARAPRTPRFAFGALFLNYQRGCF